MEESNLQRYSYVAVFDRGRYGVFGINPDDPEFAKPMLFTRVETKADAERVVGILERSFDDIRFSYQHVDGDELFVCYGKQGRSIGWVDILERRKKSKTSSDKSRRDRRKKNF